MLTQPTDTPDRERVELTEHERTEFVAIIMLSSLRLGIPRPVTTT